MQRREEQDEELAALRSRLAGEWDAGADSGSRAAQEQGAALAAQLAEARQQCTRFADEADGLRAEAARLAGARDGAEAALQEAQAELEQLKALLADQPGQEQEGAATARLAQLEAQNRALAAQLEALAGGAGQHAAAASHLGAKLEELQQARAGWLRPVVVPVPDARLQWPSCMLGG